MYIHTYKNKKSITSSTKKKIKIRINCNQCIKLKSFTIISNFFEKVITCWKGFHIALFPVFQWLAVFECSSNDQG